VFKFLSDSVFPDSKVFVVGIQFPGLNARLVDVGVLKQQIVVGCPGLLPHAALPHPY